MADLQAYRAKLVSVYGEAIVQAKYEDFSNLSDYELIQQLNYDFFDRCREDKYPDECEEYYLRDIAAGRSAILNTTVKHYLDASRANWLAHKRVLERMERFEQAHVQAIKPPPLDVKKEVEDLKTRMDKLWKEIDARNLYQSK